MANLKALHWAGESLARFLERSYEVTGPKATVAAKFAQFGTGNLPVKTPDSPTIGITLYRTGWNEHLRTPSGAQATRKKGALALDLFYLITAWGDTAQAEQYPFAWTLLHLHRHPVLDRSMLRGDADWAPSDKLELTPLDLPHDEMTRIWDKFSSPYRLSAAYAARVLILEPMRGYEEFLPVAIKTLDVQTSVPEELS
jgi:hypothetical protein